MKAYAKKTFTGAFLLDEEKVTKLHDIVEKRRVERHPDCAILLKIYRADNFVFETATCAELAKEENGPTNAIRRIEILINGDGMRFALVFDQAAGIQLDIEGSNRDFVFLLYSDLKSYVESEVIRARRIAFQKETYEIFGYIIIALGFLYFGLTYVLPSQVKPADALLNSNDVHEKLNYLMMRTSKTAFDFRILLASMVLGMLFSYIPTHILSRFPQQNVFYFGKGVAAYDRYVAVRSKLLWGVAIAFAVSFAASIVAWLMTRGT